MRTLVLLLILLFSLAVFGDNPMPDFPEQTLQKLKTAGFFVSFPADIPKQVSVNPDAIESAGRRLLQIVVPNLFAPVGKSPVLAICPSTSLHPDGFAVSAELGADKITAFISEFKANFIILPAKPSPQDEKTAQSAFESWPNRILKPMCRPEGIETLKILDKGEFFLIYKVYLKDEGHEIYLPSRAESLILALDKAGRWGIISLRDDYLDHPKPNPQSVRDRFGGSWFTDPPKDKSKIYRKFGPIELKPASSSHNPKN
jgi:hypothetical protein